MMVGGLAARFHVHNRETDDLDMWIDHILENRQNLRNAFAAQRYGDFPSIETMQFVPGCTSFCAAGIVLDIMTDMKGLEAFSFDECYRQARVFVPGTVEVPFLNIEHLIQNKKVVNRPKDQLDVIALEQIKKLKNDHD